MCLADFLRYFDSLSVCYHYTPRATAWHELRFQSQFVLSKGGAQTATPAFGSSFYHFTLSSDATVFLSIHQADTRVAGTAPYIDIGALIYCEEEKKVVCDTQFVLERSVSQSVVLPPGQYVVIPYTSGAKMLAMKSCQRPFALAIHSDVAMEVRALPVDPPLLHAALLDIGRSTANEKSFNDVVSVYSHWSGPVLTYAVHVATNTTSTSPDKRNFEITLDCGKSENAISSVGNLKATHVLSSGELAVFHRLCPADDSKGYTFKYGIAWRSL